MDKRASRDLLSNLPLSIIHTILELLPIREAVHTSILSRQWRYKWATLPHLSFCHDSVENSETEIKDFITQLLFLHQGPILKFEACFGFETDVSRNINTWLTFLARNDIRMLILNLSVTDSDNILSSIYSCQNLTNLELYFCDLPPPPPTFKGFLCLRRLKLEFVCASSNTIQSLLTDFTLLEELSLAQYDPRTAYSLKIHAPNLKIIKLVGFFQDICFYAPLLREMEMDIKFEGHAASTKNSACTCTELLGGLIFLEKLKGGLYFFEFLSIGIESCDTPLEFPHLRIIELSLETFHGKKIESVLAHICKGSPNLHKIGVSYMDACHTALPEVHLGSKCPFNFTFERLKVLDLDYSYSIDSDGLVYSWMELIKCLLASSPALETLICARPSVSDGELLKQALTLLTYPRASPNAKIVFRES